MTEVPEIFKNISAEEFLKMLAAVFPNGQHSKTTKDVTIRQGFSEYNKLIEFNLEPKTVAAAKVAERQFLKFIPENRIINSIERKDAENLMMKISKSAPLGSYGYLKVFRTIFNVFVDWNYTLINPFLKVKLPKRQIEEPIAFTDEQIDVICERLEARGKNVIADMVLFAVETGMRLDEENSLRWRDIDFNNRVIIIGSRLYKTKSKKIRRIPFNDTMEEILKRNSKRQMDNGKILREFVFIQNNGKQYKKDTISKTLKKICREEGMSDELHWHCLRATAATRWASNKVPIFTVSKLLGHSNPSITSRFYANVDLEELRDAVNRI